MRKRNRFILKHIKNPKDPVLIFGIEPHKVLEKLKHIQANGKDKNGRKLRKDAQIMAGCVASIPLPPTPENLKSEQVKKWLKDQHNFMLSEFGDSYVGQYLHIDESNIHTHSLLIATMEDCQTVSLDRIHPGYTAQRAVSPNAGRTEKKAAYQEAMREFQDSYYAKVGIENGQLRYGPKRKRLTRKEWNAEKRYAQLLKDTIESYKSEIFTLKTNLSKLVKYLKNTLSKTKIKKGNTYEL